MRILDKRKYKDYMKDGEMSWLRSWTHGIYSMYETKKSYLD